MMKGLAYIREMLSSYTWDLALGQYDESILTKGVDINNLKIVRNPYKKKWFADPFILSEDENTIQLLVEEFDQDVKKGRIARLIISKRDNSILECKIILELDTHLSFPAIYRVENMVYVHPENSASGKSLMYRYDQKQDKLVDPIEILPKPLTDAVIFKIEDAYYMYSTVLPHNGGPDLHVYCSASITGPYIERESLDCKGNTARMAGAVLNTSKGRIRPAQDCTHDYGEAVLFYEGFSKIGEIRPEKNGPFAGVHTFNTMENTFVIDLKKYKYYRLRKFIKGIIGKY